MIRLSKCTKLFGRSLALNSISIDISATGLLLVLGSNGAGKSTFLRACAGLLTPTSGSVTSTEAISYMGHSAMLYPQLSVAENMNFFRAIQNITDANSAHDWLEIEELGSRLVSDLSQGQRARVGLARVLLGSDNRALLLDEPSAAFDQHWQKILINKLQEFAANRLVMMVTHDPERYLAFASRVIILSQGVLVHDFILNADADRSAVLRAYREVLR